ncbi:putative sepB protein [Fusarium proliferatum ET1]|uniref:Minichromosome loss protein 1 n=2 Tax=Gibberella intermedia TaxID=948311 RepID=A0A420SGY3_GIBIN|nr:putative sepB protein [Fusarium proliferatum ET1]KAG4256895.1 chromosome transmission fidelity protein 4 [Fusarium proliferatum]RKL28542.1 Minichromosome loss protein 1 [Fusarium proliferatum]CZR41481.1 probable sepB protein [Fusarium proliferatum ET1]
MDSTIASKPRPRPAHTQGTTRCAYTPDGTRLVTVGSNNTIRLYKTGSDGEPINIDDCQEQNMAVAAGDEFFVVGSEDGTVSLYSLETHTFERFLTRTVLPIRDVALSSDRQWCAVASDELSVKIVNTKDITQVKHLREHARAVRNVSFDPQGRLVALSGTDGIVYVYSLTAEEPELIRKVDGIIGAIDGDSETSTRVAWHPDGRAFAVPTPVRDIQIISKNDWEKQRTFANGHLSDITAIAWSPNGALLASASKDGKVLIWETKTQSVIARYDYSNVIDIVWHPTKNIVSFTTTDGEVYIYPDFLTDQFSPLLKLATQPAPFIHDPLAELSANRRPPPVNGQKQQGLPTRPRRESLGSLDSFLEGGDGYGDDDFVEDDDGAGYTVGQGQKRPRDGDDGYGTSNKRRHMLEPQYHEAFQPGATPWRGNRKYLCLNLIGFVWTVDQDSHHTVTVEFYDHELHRDFHFSDTFLYDKACLAEHGTLFSCPPKDDAPAVIFYRPHETWTQRHDWRIELPKDEAVTAMSLSESFITVTTSANYVRVYTLFGMPYRVYRPKSTPMVTCASWRDYVLTMGNGPMGADGNTRLLYTIENVKRDEICQNEDTVALPEGATLKSVFFSDNGDPCIYDSTGTLLTLLHWRQPSRASWVPLLDTKLMDRLASGRKNESYFPIAVADNKFHCIILKGGDQYPYFPRPLLSEFDFSIPIATAPKTSKRKAREGSEDLDMGDGDEDKDDEDDGSAETRKLEQQFMLHNVGAAQLRDLMEATSGSHALRSQLSRLELEIDKTLLQLLAVECREGEERGMRALEMVQLMRDRTGRMMDAAGKVAERYGRTILGEKIREFGEKRVGGLEDDEFP